MLIVGVLVMLGACNRLGRLPGGLRIEGERTRVHIPITSMTVVSILLTVVRNLLLRR